MKKKIKDVTCKEFLKWAHDRACDGMWSGNDANDSVAVIGRIYDIRPLLGTNKTREKEWNRIKGEYFSLDKEIDI